MYHSTFSPQLANRSQWKAALAHAADAWGINTMRVFLDSGARGRNDSIAGDYATTRGVSGEYLDKLAEYVTDSAQVGIYTVLTLSGTASNAYFDELAQQGRAPYPPASFSYQNRKFMDMRMIEAKAKYVELLLAGLQERLRRMETDLSALLAISLENEGAFGGDSPPFSLSSGNITAADGLSYDMADDASRQQAADANAVLWANRLAQAARTVDPKLLVTAGMFTYQAIGMDKPNGMRPSSDGRIPLRPASLSKYSSLDFLDIHVYPNIGVNPNNWTLEADLNTEEWDLVDKTRTPVLMLEYGAFKDPFPSAEDAARALVSLRAESCKLGFTNGWLVWTLDTYEQPRLWNMASKNGAIGDALAVKGSPCKSDAGRM